MALKISSFVNVGGGGAARQNTTAQLLALLQSFTATTPWEQVVLHDLDQGHDPECCHNAM